MKRPQVTILLVATIVAALIPAAILTWDLAFGNLTANPIQAIQLRTGKTAIDLLFLSLLCTPVYLVSGYGPALLVRRVLGVGAFLYSLLHFINFAGIDYGFNFQFIRQDAFATKPYFLAGLGAFLLLLPLALTSTRAWTIRLGNNWQRLHRLVYPAAILAVMHFVWQSKADVRLPLAYGAVLVLILIIRFPPIRRYATRHLKTGSRTSH
jgi:methionine sulfoxide reductase heme-binding subunit